MCGNIKKNIQFLTENHFDDLETVDLNTVDLNTVNLNTYS